MTPNQLRQKYLDFFKAQGHAVIPSAPLVPENDPTTLFTGSGMQPLVPYLLGQPHPEGTRLVDSQKSFRSQDIEEVGDNRHTTFFEMLGNWSLGDYFKKEQLTWFFTFLTAELGLDPKRLFVTVFAGDEKLGIPKDDESVAIWNDLFSKHGIEAQALDMTKEYDQESVKASRIFYYPAKKNWWSRAGVPENMPAGEPGGPDSEVFYDFGAELQLHEKSAFKDEICHVNCDCGRFLEIGNSVFMQYQKQDDGSFKELPQKNVDFGGGFERLLAVIDNQMDVFQTELFTPIISHLEKLSGVSYQVEAKKHAFRVIADHIRAAVMLAADGVYPSNKEQGYFSRRLLRRAIRYGKQLGIDRPLLAELVPVVAELYRQPYPEVSEQAQVISQRFSEEEQKFNRTLDKGLREFSKLVSGRDQLTAELAFTLYETYGFPLELSVEEARSRQLAVEEGIEEKFAQAKHQHADASRTASAGKFKGGLADNSENTVKYHTATHLLHAALRKILGTHVQQKGSNITGERLRFDFSHPDALTDEQKQAVEQQINDWIAADLPVTKQIMAKTDALASGAIAFFVEKYPDEVSVYTIGRDLNGTQDEGWISKEFCGGPHVTQTGEIGPIKLTKEQSVSAGVRRVYMELV